MKPTSALWGAIVVLGGLTGAWAESPRESKVAFDLVAQPLSEALNALAVRSQLHIVFNAADAEGVQAQGIQGSYTPSEALKLLLARTDLSYEFVDERTVEIRAGKKIRGLGNPAASARASSDGEGLRLTRVGGGAENSDT